MNVTAFVKGEKEKNKVNITTNVMYVYKYMTDKDTTNEREKKYTRSNLTHNTIDCSSVDKRRFFSLYIHTYIRCMCKVDIISIKESARAKMKMHRERKH
jgi:hypothetical protein